MAYDVSIVIPVYNGFRGVPGSKWLEDSICSALHSDHSNFQVVIVDDGSDDGTLESIHALLNRNNLSKHTEVIPYSVNYGVGYALNVGIHNSDAKYIATQGSDDLCKPERIRLQAQALDNNNDLQMVGCYYWICDAEGILTGELTEEHIAIDPDEIHLRLISGNPRIGAPMFRKSLWKEIGGFDEGDLGRCCEDYDFFLRTTDNYPRGIAVVPEMLYGYRNSPISITKEEHNKEFYLCLKQSRERRKNLCKPNWGTSPKALQS